MYTFNYTRTTTRVLQEPTTQVTREEINGLNLFQCEFRLTFPCFQARSVVS